MTTEPLTPDNKPKRKQELVDEISLSQAILAPLDGLFKAQLHAARSFLNLLLQLGYKHLESDEPDAPPKVASIDDLKPYMLDFAHDISDGEVTHTEKVSIPALALVPIAPLAVESAEFKFSLEVSEYQKHEQMQPILHDKFLQGKKFDSETERPWYLVDTPVSFISKKLGKSQDGSEARREIEISIKVSKMAIPSALEKLLTTLSQNIVSETHPEVKK